MNNLVISYDLHELGKDYASVTQAVKALSPFWAKIHYSVFYVKANLTAAQARDKLLPAIDKNDSLLVVDATNNSCAWFNLSPESSEYLKTNWNVSSIDAALGALYR